MEGLAASSFRSTFPQRCDLSGSWASRTDGWAWAEAAATVETLSRARGVRAGPKCHQESFHDKHCSLQKLQPKKQGPRGPRRLRTHTLGSREPGPGMRGGLLSARDGGCASSS